MRHLLGILILCTIALQANSQNGIIGSGFAAGWNNPNDVLGFSQGFGTSRIAIVNPNGTGNQYFRFVKYWNFNNTEFGPSSCSDEDLTSVVNTQINNMNTACGGAFYINCPNVTDNYVFKSNDPDGDDVIYFRVQGPVREITNVTQPTMVFDSEPVTITATTDDVLPLGQSIFLRYTTDGFASSEVVAMNATSSFAAPQNYTAVIPGQPQGTTVTYYTFTSGAEPTPSEADWYTINGNTNGGANYSYTVQMTLPVELTHFTGRSQENFIQLSWQTASEVNFAYFEIEKYERTQWVSLGTVRGAAAGSNQGSSYQYKDTMPSSGTNLYRLKNVDLDGSVEYSKAISVVHRSTGLSIFPTVMIDDITLAGLERDDSYYLLDATGRSIIFGSAGEQSSLTVPILHLPAGAYFMQVRTADNRLKYVEKLIKI